MSANNTVFLTEYYGGLKSRAQRSDSNDRLRIRVNATDWTLPLLYDIIHTLLQICRACSDTAISGLRADSGNCEVSGEKRICTGASFVVLELHLGSPLEIIGAFADWNAIAPNLSSSVITAVAVWVLRCAHKQRERLPRLLEGPEKASPDQQWVADINHLAQVAELMAKLSENKRVQFVEYQIGRETLRVSNSVTPEVAGTKARKRR